MSRCNQSVHAIIGDLPSKTLDARYLIEILPAGHKGQGIFAKSPIKLGTRVLCDRAMISSSHDRGHEYQEVLQSFQALSAEKKKMYMTLQPYPSPDLERDVKKELNKRWEDLPSQDREVLARWEANCFTGYGVSFLACKFNHSCVPNLHWAVNRETRCITFHANRDIEAGEELMNTYTPENNIEDTDERRERLRQWGFACTCKACGDTAEAEEMDRKRIAMKRLEEAMDKERDDGYYLDAIRSAQKEVELSWEFPRECSLHVMLVLVNLNFEARNFNGARVWASRWLKLAEILLGADHPCFRRMLYFVKRRECQTER